MQYNITHSLHSERGKMEKNNSYFKCTTRDGKMHFFDKRCNSVKKIFDGNMLAFKENSGKREITLAIIPIDFIETIENINAPSAYEEEK